MFNDHRFIVTIPDGFPLEAAGPVFCAGITMYSPLVQWKVRRSQEQGGDGGGGSMGNIGILGGFLVP